MERGRIAQRLHQRLRFRFRFRQASLRKDNPEFIAAEPPDNVGLAHLRQKQRGDMDQAGIAGRMAILVVDLFEAVQIDENECGGVAIAFVHRQGARQFTLEGATIEHRNERVEIGQSLRLAKPLLQKIDVALEALVLREHGGQRRARLWSQLIHRHAGDLLAGAPGPLRPFGISDQKPHTPISTRAITSMSMVSVRLNFGQINMATRGDCMQRIHDYSPVFEAGT